MAKAKKKGKPKRNRKNLVKKLRVINKNQEILKRIKDSLNP
jgi:hypothetical protein